MSLSACVREKLLVSGYVCVCVSVCYGELLMIEMLIEMEQSMGQCLYWFNLEVSYGN